MTDRSGWHGVHTNQAAARSCHIGLDRSISANFFARRQDFSCFSQAMASEGLLKLSVWTSMVTL